MFMKRSLAFLIAVIMLFAVTFSVQVSALSEGWYTDNDSQENVLYLKNTLSCSSSVLKEYLTEAYGTGIYSVYDGDSQIKGDTVNFSLGTEYSVKQGISNKPPIAYFRVCLFYDASVAIEIPEELTAGDVQTEINGVPCADGETVSLLSENGSNDIFEIRIKEPEGYMPVLRVGDSEKPAELTAEEEWYTYANNFSETKSTIFNISYEEKPDMRAELLLPDDFTETFYFDSVKEIRDYIESKVETATYTDTSGEVRTIELSYDLTEALSSISADRDGEEQTVSFSVYVDGTEEHYGAEKIYTLPVVGRIHTLSFGENITVSKNGMSVMSGDTLSVGEYTVTVTPDEGRYIKNIFVNGEVVEPEWDLSDGKAYSFVFEAENTETDYHITAEADVIPPAEVKIIIDNKKKFVYEDDPVFTCTVEGLDEGEILENLFLVREKGTKAGKYRISAIYSVNEKYNITVVDGYLTVSHDSAKTVTDKATEPECGKTGLTEGSHCSGCGEVFTAQAVIPAKTHSYTVRTTRNATCTAEGLKTYTCTWCDHKYTEKIKSLGHSFSSSYTVDKKATYKASGSKSKHCIRKGCTAKKSFTSIPMLALSKVTGLKVSSSVTSVKASWKKVKGAEKYRIELLNSKGKVIKSATTQKTSYTFKKLSKATVYKIRVRAEADKNKGAYIKSVATATLPSKVTVKVLKSSGKKTASLYWKKQSDVSGYQVQYSTSKKFRSSKTVTVKKSKTVKLTLKKLKSKKTYYVRVRAYKAVNGKRIYGAWSTVKSAKVK